MSVAADFRDCIIVQDPTYGDNGRGGRPVSFADSAVSFFAKIIPKHFSKKLENGKHETGIEYMVTIKEEPAGDIQEKRFKIDADSRILKILSMMPSQRRDEFEFRCVEVPVGG